MKADYTHIIGVESNSGGVSIKVLAKGEEEPYYIAITPHDTYVHLSIGGIGDRNLLPIQTCANYAEVHFVELKDRSERIAEFKRRGQIPI